MEVHLHHFIAGGIFAGLAGSVALPAAGQGMPLLSPVTADTPGPPLPNWRASGTARFLCGGVGDREQQALRKASPRDVLLTFTMKTGQYLTDVEIEISEREGGGAVLSTRCEGPLMVLDLPHPGGYEIRARAAGIERRHEFDVPASGGLSIVLQWPVAPDRTGGVSE